MRSDAMHCDLMQCNAMRCDAMSCGAMRCHAMQWDAMYIIFRGAKRKLCARGHINDNVRANRKVCDRDACNAPLDMGKSEPAKNVAKEKTQN